MKKPVSDGFPVVQCLRVHLSLQGTLVWYLVRGDPTRLWEASPVPLNEPALWRSWVATTEPVSLYAATTEPVSLYAATTKPVCSYYWAREPICSNYWSLRSWSLCSTTGEATPIRSPYAQQLQSSPCLPQLEKAHVWQRRPRAAKHKYFLKSVLKRFVCRKDVWETEILKFKCFITGKTK